MLKIYILNKECIHVFDYTENLDIEKRRVHSNALLFRKKREYP